MLTKAWVHSQLQSVINLVWRFILLCLHVCLFQREVPVICGLVFGNRCTFSIAEVAVVEIWCTIYVVCFSRAVIYMRNREVFLNLKANQIVQNLEVSALFHDFTNKSWTVKRLRKWILLDLGLALDNLYTSNIFKSVLFERYEENWCVQHK